MQLTGLLVAAPNHDFAVAGATSVPVTVTRALSSGVTVTSVPARRPLAAGAMRPLWASARTER